MGGRVQGSKGAKNDDILYDVPPWFRVYKDGRMERLRLGESPNPVPPSLDTRTGVESQDIKLSPETGLIARLFKPVDNPSRKKSKSPLLLYFHGGAFCMETTASPIYHNYLNTLASQAQTLILSVDCRRAPENPLPAAYDDAWLALNWVTTTTHPWLRDRVDFSRVFLAGDSSGGNISHRLGVRLSQAGGVGPIRRLNGIILIHPVFWGKDRIGDEVEKCKSLPYPYNIVEIIWSLACPGPGPRPIHKPDLDHPWLNPTRDPTLSRLGCDRVLIFVAENDFLRDRGLQYKELLEKSDWPGKSVELVESKGKYHVFHLTKPSSPKAVHLMNKLVAFLNPDVLTRCSL